MTQVRYLLPPQRPQSVGLPSGTLFARGDGTVAVESGSADEAALLAMGATAPNTRDVTRANLLTELALGQGIGRDIKNALTGSIARDVVLIIIGDSTGDDVADWVYLYSQRLAAALPASVRVEYSLYDSVTTNQYGTPTVIQAGSGEPAVVVGADGRGWGIPGALIGPLGADRDIKVEFSLEDWNTGIERTICAQYGSAGSRAFRFYIAASGAIVFEWKTDGTNGPTAVSVSNPGYAANSRRWLRATLDVDNGSGGYTANIYSSDDKITWSQLAGTSPGGGATSVWASTAQVYELGSRGGSTSASAVSGCPGTFHNFEISDVINGANKAPVLVRNYLETFGMNGYRKGGPCLKIFNGSISGNKMSQNTTIIERVCPRISGAAHVILNSSHNEGSTFNGPTFIDDLDAQFAAVRTRVQNPRFVLNTQNPEYAPREAQRIDAQARRAALIRELASQLRVDVIDAFSAFGSNSALVMPDGIHPTAAGSALWAETAWSTCGIPA